MEGRDCEAKTERCKQGKGRIGGTETERGRVKDREIEKRRVTGKGEGGRGRRRVHGEEGEDREEGRIGR